MYIAACHIKPLYKKNIISIKASIISDESNMADYIKADATINVEQTATRNREPKRISVHIIHVWIH